MREHFAGSGLADVLPAWSEADIAAVREDGKIAKLARWEARLAAGDVGLDAVMNLSALMSFTADQAAMDERIAGLLGQV